METGEGHILLPDRDLELAVKNRMIEMIMGSFSKLSPEVQSILREAFRKIRSATLERNANVQFILRFNSFTGPSSHVPRQPERPPSAFSSERGSERLNAYGGR